MEYIQGLNYLINAIQSLTKNPSLTLTIFVNILKQNK